jgi:alkyldihydroxyacetonephosphate synthase
MTRERSWWGWGWVDEAVDGPGCAELAARVAPFLPLDGDVTPAPDLAALTLPAPRVVPPANLDHLYSGRVSERAAHTYGKAYRDVVRALRGDLDGAPDLVAYPADEADVTAILDWAGSNGVAVVPYGGGTSVVGGIELRDPSRPWVSLDTSRLAGVEEIDNVSLAARIRAGTYGPAIEDGLRGQGLTLRHFPQSFEFSTLGGWIATRAGGHFATGYTHIDDLVEAVRIVTPVGVAQSARVPASGAGPSPDRLWLGSEGILGVVTEAWVRVRRRPRFTAAAAVRFSEYDDAVAATREVAQSGLAPANCRLLDLTEAALGAGAADGTCRLLLGFESADAPVDASLARAIEICRAHGGESTSDSTVREWRGTFVRAPYLRDGLARLGVVVETFETACPWAAYPALHAAVVETAVTAGLELTGVPAVAASRLTHVYPDGPAPYFTVYAAGRRGAEVEIWDAIKALVSDTILGHGGTITHHHAVGRDHRPWYDRERPPPFAVALRAAKAALDPHGILNPGVLIDPLT